MFESTFFHDLDHLVHIATVGHPYIDTKTGLVVLVAPVNNFIGGDQGIWDDHGDIVCIQT